jgi:hypothetical protein
MHAWSNDGILVGINKLLHLLQSGFKANHRTTTALLKTIEDLIIAADLKCGSVLTPLDFSNAFDSIFRRPLFQ